MAAPLLLLCDLPASMLGLNWEGSHGHGQRHPAGAPGWCSALVGRQEEAGMGWESPGPRGGLPGAPWAASGR